MAPTTAEVLKRLESLQHHLDEEGWHVHSNTVWLAIEEIKQLRELSSALAGHIAAASAKTMLAASPLTRGQVSPHRNGEAEMNTAAATNMPWAVYRCALLGLGKTPENEAFVSGHLSPSEAMTEANRLKRHYRGHSYTVGAA